MEEEKKSSKTAGFRKMGNGMMMILPEHPQAQLQSKLLALVFKNQPPLLASSSSPQNVQQPDPPKKQKKEKVELKMQTNITDISIIQLMKKAEESPESRRKDDVITPPKTQQKKQCNCKNSQCLKLYCECFASGIYCDDCNCRNCYNNLEWESSRQLAVGSILERNPNAFRSKIANSPHRFQDNRVEAGEIAVLGKHSKGCNCKRSSCLKKYCECFQANIRCSENCRCRDCKNYEGSQEERLLYRGQHANVMAFTREAPVVPINGIALSNDFGTPPAVKKRKFQHLDIGQSYGDLLDSQSSQIQESHLTSPNTYSSHSSVPQSGTVTATVLQSSNSMCRSPLATTCGPMDVKDLCSLLVVVSAEALNKFTNAKHIMDREAVIDQIGDSVSSSAQQCQDKVENDFRILSEDQRDKTQMGASGSEPADIRNDREMSPGTLDLMCDEQDTIFMGAQSPTGSAGCKEGTTINSYYMEDFAEVYAEQERLVLTTFLNHLNQLITSGSIKAAMLPSSAKTTTARRREPLQNGSIESESQRRCDQPSFERRHVSTTENPVFQ